MIAATPVSSENPQFEIGPDTPAMRQYRQFKQAYPDYILFFRMGDFYEMFFEDAKIASQVLGLALTSRSKGATAIPLAGIPYHACDAYLAKLIAAGHRVAICEQVEDPKQAKGVVRRDIVRLMTPGTLTEENLLDRRESNYLAAIFDPKGAGGTAVLGRGQATTDAPAARPAAAQAAQVGIAWVELSGGTFEAMIAPAQHVLDELMRIRPAEVIVAEGSALDAPAFREALRQYLGAAATARPPWAFDGRAATELLQQHFRTETLAGFGFEGYSPALSAAGALIDYLKETQKTALEHIRSLRPFDRNDWVQIDGNTLRCLEVLRSLRNNRRAGTLLEAVDATVTGMGARLLQRWLSYPLRSYSAILARQDAIEELLADTARLDALRQQLSQTSQIDRIAANIAMGRVRPRELLGLKQTLQTLPRLVELLGAVTAEPLQALPKGLAGLEAPAALIERAISPDSPPILREGGVIADGFDEELDRLRSIAADGASWLAEYQAGQIARTGISNLKVGYNKVFGYYIEISNAQSAKAPADYVRKQTIKNAERYITDELKRYESEVLTASERAKGLESRLFEQVRAELAAHVARFQEAAAALAVLDVLCGLARLAADRHWHRPSITQENLLRIVGGRHPVLECTLGSDFVPNDVEMGVKDDRLLIITGPNMAGKSR